MIESSNLQPLPEGWMWTTLEEVIIRISNGITRRQSKDKIGTSVTRIETISNGTIDLRRVGYLKELSPHIIEKYKLLPGDVLFSHINSDLHLGKTALFDFSNILLLHGMNLLLIRPNKALLVPKFLNYLCNQYRFSGIFVSIAQHAVNQSSINQAKLKNLPISLPPFPEQHRIVAKIEELFTKHDAGVKSLEKTKAQLKRYRQSVLKHAFEGKLTEEWRERHKDELEPASVLLERIKEERKKNVKEKYKELPPLDASELPELPEWWVWTRLNDVISENLIGIVRSSSQQNKNDHGYGYIKMNNVTMDGKVVLSDLVYVDASEGELERYSLRKGDILFNTRNSVELVGKTGIVRFDAEKFVYNNNLMRIRTSDQISPYLLVYQMCSHQFRSRMEKVKRATTNVAALYAKDILPLPVLLMPQAEQHKIAEEIERRFSVADKAEKVIDQSLKKAERLRQSILKKAFEGKLMPQDPTDEPASVLLERIKEDRENREIEAQSKTKTKRKRDLVQKQRRFNDYVK